MPGYCRLRVSRSRLCGCRREPRLFRIDRVPPCPSSPLPLHQAKASFTGAFGLVAFTLQTFRFLLSCTELPNANLRFARRAIIMSYFRVQLSDSPLAAFCCPIASTYFFLFVLF